jgi:hypothetical protein
MAGNLLKAGHQVTVYNRTPGKATALVSQGAQQAASVGDACKEDATITMLADNAAVEAVVFGEGGVLATLPEGAIHRSSSKISVALSERLASAHSEAGQRFVAAPVFGRPDAAAAGRLFIVAAGDLVAIETVRPLLEALGQATFTIRKTFMSSRPPIAHPSRQGWTTHHQNPGITQDVLYRCANAPLRRGPVEPDRNGLAVAPEALLGDILVYSPGDLGLVHDHTIRVELREIGDLLVGMRAR